MIELIEKRQENSKTFDLGNRSRRLEVYMGAVHYKDNYASDEQWKDIELTWAGNKITKAPYELTLDGTKLTLKDKKTGETSTIELLDAKPLGMKWKIIPENTRVSFRHILPSDKIPFEAKFKITGKGLITTKAFDDDGELMLDVAVVGDTLTEKLSGIRDKQTGQVRPAKGQIKVDPTWQVGASADDCGGYGTYFDPAYSDFRSGFYVIGEEGNYSGMRVTSVTIPKGATIDTAYLILQAMYSDTATVVNTNLHGEAADNPGTFTDYTDFWARTRTGEFVAWDAIPAWTAETIYNSPEIKTIIQEIVNRAGWASGNSIVIFWRNDGSTETAGVRRRAYSYDTSTTKAPQLVITYTPPAVTAKTSSDTGSGADAKLTGNPKATLVKSETGTGADAKVALQTTLLGFIRRVVTISDRTVISAIPDRTLSAAYSDRDKIVETVTEQ